MNVTAVDPVMEKRHSGDIDALGQWMLLQKNAKV